MKGNVSAPGRHLCPNPPHRRYGITRFQSRSANPDSWWRLGGRANWGTVSLTVHRFLTAQYWQSATRGQRAVLVILGWFSHRGSGDGLHEIGERKIQRNGKRKYQGQHGMVTGVLWCGLG